LALVQSGQLSIAIYLPDLSGGGAEHLHVMLASEFLKAGCAVTFVLDRATGVLLPRLPDGCIVEHLGVERPLKALSKLVAYLKRNTPDVLIANMEHQNIVTLWAKALSGTSTKILVTQHNTLSEQAKRPGWRYRLLPVLYRLFLGGADAIVAVSRGVADDMTRCGGIASSRISVIHNGVVDEGFYARSEAALDGAGPGAPVPTIVAIGRLVPAKDFPTLILAFAELRKHRDVRLTILGEGPQRAELEALTRKLDVQDYVSMPGFVNNPLPYVHAAKVFVLSSRFEGFGNVLVEALACGTPVVSTDCPHGPSEILEGGKYGPLVPVGNATALAAAINSVFDVPLSAMQLRQRGMAFTVSACAKAYLALIHKIVDPRSATAVLSGGVK
jgi:glycosyltransferase involved in cell wall biosynthesis